MFRAVLAGVALTFVASNAPAQITTYIAPPRAKAPSSQMIAAADSARRDSIAEVTMTNMKSWVDSAAGVVVPDHVGDTVVANDPGRPVVTTFDDGAVAPATASNLPALLLVGVLAMGAGAALLRGRPRE